MTILIKGIEMPTDPFYPIHATIYADGTVITGHGVGEFAKEAVPVPAPHGRLIDTNKLEVHDGWLSETKGYSTHITFVYSNAIDLAPTVIENGRSKMKSRCETCRNIPCWDYDTRGDKECMDYDRMSNADRIRAMTDEELAKMLPSKSMWNCPPDIKTRGGCPGQCVPCWLDWLKQEVTE